MKELIDKFVELERKISEAKGGFVLFALFLRDDAPDKWDLLVAAPWIDTARKTAFLYIAKQIQSFFKPDEITQLSRIVIIDQTNPALDIINKSVKIEHGVAAVQDRNYFNLQIKHAFIITSQKPKVNIGASAI